MVFYVHGKFLSQFISIKTVNLGGDKFLCITNSFFKKKNNLVAIASKWKRSAGFRSKVSDKYWGIPKSPTQSEQDRQLLIFPGGGGCD